MSAQAHASIHVVGGSRRDPPTTAFISSSPIQRQIFTGFFPGAAQGMQRHMRRGNIYMSIFGQRGIFLRPQENGFRHQMLRKQSPGVDHPPPGNARSPLSHDSTHHARVTSHQVSNRTICHHVPFRHAFDSSQNFFHTQILHSTSPQHIPLQKHVVRHTLPIRQHARCLIKEADPRHRELSLAHLNKLHRLLPNIRQSGCAPSEKTRYPSQKRRLPSPHTQPCIQRRCCCTPQTSAPQKPTREPQPTTR